MINRQFFLSLGILFVVCVSATAHESPRYGYSASDGPGKWASLSPDYEQCSTGSLQSPINIEPEDAKAAENVKLERTYESYINNSVLVNTGTHVELRLLPEHGSATFNGSTYQLAYLRFHTQAEHTIKNKTFPMELQIVHQDQSGNELIVSQLYRLGNADTFLYQLRQELQSLAGEKCGDDEESQIVVQDELKTKSVKKSGGTYYGYVGSQTVPPCKQGVLWFISKKERTLTLAQLNALQGPVKSVDNARHVFTKGSYDLMKYED